MEKLTDLTDQQLTDRQAYLETLTNYFGERLVAVICEQDRRLEGEPLPEFGVPFSRETTVVPFARPNTTPAVRHINRTRHGQQWLEPEPPDLAA